MIRSTIRRAQVPGIQIGNLSFVIFTPVPISQSKISAKVELSLWPSPDHEQISAVVKGNDSVVGTRRFNCTWALDDSWLVI
jgi:hypothetical protein